MPGGAWSAQQRFVERDRGVHAKSGHYSLDFPWPYWQSWVHVEAAGYLPADSRIFTTEEGTATADIELEPAANIVVKVLQPDGCPPLPRRFMSETAVIPSSSPMRFPKTSRAPPVSVAILAL